MIPEKVRAVLAANGLTAKEFAPGSTATSVLAAQQLGVQVSQIAVAPACRRTDASW